MKKSIKLTLLLIMIFILSGCAKYDLNMSITADKEITLDIITAIQKEYYQDNGQEDVSEYEKLGYTVEQYDDGTYKGLKLTKKYQNIDEISSSDVTTFELTDLLEKNTNEIKLLKSEETNNQKIYTASFTYNLQDIDEENIGQNDGITNMSNNPNDFQSSIMSFTYSISLPKNAVIISNDADYSSDDGHSLYWNISYGTINNINFCFSFDENAVVEEEDKEEDNDDTTNNPIPNDNSEDKNENVTTSQNQNSHKKIVSYINYVITGLLFLIIVLVVLAVKIKLSKKSSIDNSQIYHQEPPNNKSM